MSKVRNLTLGLCALLGGSNCDGGHDDAVARAAAEAERESKAAEAAAAARKLEREQKAAEEEAAAKARLEAIDALATLPERLPKKLSAACDELVRAYDGYMREVLTGDLKTKWETGGNEMQLGIQRRECQKRSIEIAACQTAALGQMTPEHEKDMSEIFGRCVAKFGPSG